MTGVGAHLKLFDSAPYTISVRRVEYKDECICVVEIMLPQRSQLFLASNVPDSEYNVFVLYFLDVETCETFTNYRGSRRLLRGGKHVTRPCRTSTLSARATHLRCSGDVHI